MDAQNTEQLTDAEAVNCGAIDAEAALLALGEPLEWRGFRIGGMTLSNAHAEAVYRDGAYGLAEASGEIKEFGQWKAWFVSFKDENGLLVEWMHGAAPKRYAPHEYESLVAAKAACEHHHATGKWE